MTAWPRIRFHLCCDAAYWLVDADGMKCGQTCHVHGSYRWNKPNCDHCGVEASARCLDAPLPETPGEPPAPRARRAGKAAAMPPTHTLQNTACEPWCGKSDEHLPRGQANTWWMRPGPDWNLYDPLFCTERCMRAGAPQNPRKP